MFYNIFAWAYIEIKILTESDLDLFPLSYLFAAFIDLLLGSLPVEKMFSESVIKIGNL